MARRVRNDFDTELSLRFTNRSDVNSTLRGFWLDDGYLKVCNMFKHVQLQAIAPSEALPQGSDNFTPSVTDLWYPTALRNVTNGYIIRQDSLERVERAVSKPNAPPYTFYWYNGSIVVESFADTNKVIRMWYKKIPPAWQPSSSPVIDQIFDRLILTYATSAGYESLRELDKVVMEEKLAVKYAQEHKLPLEEVKLNDYRQGWKVRLR